MELEVLAFSLSCTERYRYTSVYFLMIFDYLLVPFRFIFIQNGQGLAIRQKPGLEEHSGLEKSRTTTL